MHLSVTCPRCESKYQLDPGMRGKRMRCPNTICRAIFEVRDDNDPPAPASVTPEPPPAIQEASPPRPKPAAPLEPPIKEALPPPPPPKVQEAPPRPKPVAPPKPKVARPPSADFPDDFPGDDEPTAAPAPALATEAWQPDAPPEPAGSFVETPAPAPRRRHVALWVSLVMVLALAAVVGTAWWRIRTGIESNELERYERAEALYKEHQFAETSSALQKLQRDFPDSPHHKKYRFLAELSDVRQAVYARESPEETVKALERVVQLAGVYQGDSLLKERSSDLWESLDFLSDQLTQLAQSEKSPAYLPLARRAWAETKKYSPPQTSDVNERERKHEGDWKRAETALADHFERANVIAVIKKNTERATASAVREAWTLAEKTKRQDDAEIRSLLQELFKAQREQVKYEPSENQVKAPKPDEDAFDSLSVTPSVKAERAVNVGGPPVLALARGVLYALDPARGELRWARRVGVDTRVLPLRVPADAITPELLLVLSSDQRSLSAVIAATGETLWQTALSDACLGTPVLVGRQVLVPTLAGRIDEIELAEGRVLGAYHVGQPLTLGGVHQAGSSHAYFPADEFCLYVLDVKERQCAQILYTRHPAGSLRGLPMIVPEEKKSWLLWTQAEGLAKTFIKPYALPIAAHDQKPVEPIVELPGLAAPPWQGADRLVVLSETGLLSLWGLRQKGTRDPLLFRMLPSDFPVTASRRPVRCDVVHADTETLWTMAHGGLQRVESGFQPKTGPDLLARWSQPVVVGNLLHAADVRREKDGPPILYLTTQANDRPTCFCSAVDGETGKILWQRQLGVFPQEPPRLFAGQIVLADAEGLLRFSPDVKPNAHRWASAGDWLSSERDAGASQLVLTNDGGFVQLSWPKGGTKLKIIVGQDDKIRTLHTDLPTPLQGTPALGDGFVLLPLANGIVARVSLADGAVVNGPDWRAVGADDDALGHLVPLSATDLLLTDGSRGLQRLTSADGKTWTTRANATPLSHRITAPPVVLANASKVQVCLRDASDTLTLLDAERLTVLQRWPMAGKVSAGPFVRAGKLGVIVGKNRLVWLDPGQKEPLWAYGFDADIVGEPHLIDGTLVVGDVVGQFIGLDPASGRPLGARWTLKANVAPTAAPFPYGPGRAFVPLTDGTVMLLPLNKLREN